MWTLDCCPQVKRVLGSCAKTSMTLRVPDDLADLRAAAIHLATAPTTVLQEPPLGAGWEGPELPVVRLEVDSEVGYIQLFTLPNASEEAFARALSFAEVLQQLEHLTAGAVRELFWVSGLRPLPPDDEAAESEYQVRMAVPLTGLAIADDPERVAFIAHSTA